MDNFLIYKITNPSGKFYIGVTNNFKRRMSEHFSDWKNRKQNIALHNSFSKYGFENHIKEIIIKGLSKEAAYKLEEKLINSFKSNDSKIGLNSRSGGKGGNMIDWKSEDGRIKKQKANETRFKSYLKEWDAKLPIILEMKDTHTGKQIAERLNCAESALGRYLKLKKISIKRKSKFNLQKIAEQIKPMYEQGATNQFVIEKTGYSKGTICRAKIIAYASL